jgi:hypothetical protein
MFGGIAAAVVASALILTPGVAEASGSKDSSFSKIFKRTKDKNKGKERQDESSSPWQGESYVIPPALVHAKNAPAGRYPAWFGDVEKAWNEVPAEDTRGRAAVMYMVLFEKKTPEQAVQALAVEHRKADREKFAFRLGWWGPKADQRATADTFDQVSNALNNSTSQAAMVFSATTPYLAVKKDGQVFVFNLETKNWANPEYWNDISASYKQVGVNAKVMKKEKLKYVLVE